MAALSFAASYAQWQDLVDLLNELELFGTTNSKNVVAMQNTIIAAATGDYGRLVTSAVAALRSGLGSQIAPDAVQTILAPGFADILAAINAPERGPLDIALYRLREYMLLNYFVIPSRCFSYGTVTVSGSATGTGVINRVTVDEDGFNLECLHSETKTLEVVSDQGQVEKHNEIFEVRGAKPEPDVLKVVGSGVVAQIKALSTRDSEALLNNPTFSQIGTTAPTTGAATAVTASTDVTGWVLAPATGLLAAHFKIYIDNAYRDLVGVTQTYSIEFIDDGSVTQTIETQKNAKLDIAAPYWVQVAVYRKANATGNLTITFGNTSRTIAIGGLANAAWTVCSLLADKNLYYKNFKKNTMTVAFSMASLAVGQVQIDDVICAPCQLVDGIWYAPVGGVTPWAYKDRYTVADTQSTVRGKMSYWNWRTDLGITLPNLPLRPLAAPGAALAGAGAGGVENGAHTYVFTNVDTSGRESVKSATATATVVDKTSDGKVALTLIAVAAEPSTASRKVYRSAAGTTTPLKLLTTIADNTTTVYTDNTADASLGATMSSLVGGTQISDPA